MLAMPPETAETTEPAATLSGPAVPPGAGRVRGAKASCALCSAGPRQELTLVGGAQPGHGRPCVATRTMPRRSEAALRDNKTPRASGPGGSSGAPRGAPASTNEA